MRKLAILAVIVSACHTSSKQPSQPQAGAQPKKNSAEYYYERGKTENAMTDHLAAVGSLSSAIKKNPHYADAYLERAKAYKNVDSIDREMQDYDTLISWTKAAALQGKPDQAQLGRLYYMKADALYRNSMDTVACRYWKMSRDQGFSQSWNKLRDYCK